MSENVSSVADLNDPTVVEMAFSEETLKSLPLGSAEFNAAVAKIKAAETNENSEVPADDATEQEDDEAEDSEDTSSEDEENTDETEQTRKPKRGMLKRIEKLVEEKAELKRQLEAAYKADKVAEVKDKIADAIDKSSTFEAPKPKFADFETLEDYTEALTEWKLDKREHDRQVEAQKKEVLQAHTEAVSTWHEKEAEVKKEFSDYAKVVNIDVLTDVNPSDAAKAFLSECDVGPKVLYTLLSDKETAAQFKKVSPVQQVKMLTKIEMSLEDTPSEKKTITTVTKAPTPPKSLPNGKTVRTAQDLLENSEEMSWAEWSAKYDEIKRNKRR